MTAPRRIAILKPSALGDIVHSLPVLGALRSLYPNAVIDWVVNRAFEPLLNGHPALNSTVPFERGEFKKGLWKSAVYAYRFAEMLRKSRYDLVVDLQGLFRTGAMAAATGAPVRIGFANAREGSKYAYTQRVEVPDAESIHAVDRYWRIVESMGGGDLPKVFELPISPHEADAVAVDFGHFRDRGFALHRVPNGLRSDGPRPTSPNSRIGLIRNSAGRFSSSVPAKMLGSPRKFRREWCSPRWIWWGKPHSRVWRRC